MLWWLWQGQVELPRQAGGLGSCRAGSQGAPCPSLCPQVQWLEQQVAKRRTKRDIFMEPTDPKFPQQWYLVSAGEGEPPHLTAAGGKDMAPEGWRLLLLPARLVARRRRKAGGVCPVLYFQGKGPCWRSCGSVPGHWLGWESLGVDWWGAALSLAWDWVCARACLYHRAQTQAQSLRRGLVYGPQHSLGFSLILEWFSPPLGVPSPLGFPCPMLRQSRTKLPLAHPYRWARGGPGTAAAVPAPGRSSYCQGFSRQYNTNQRDLNVRQAWAQGYTGKGIVVSILDDGIEKNHPDLEGNYVSVGRCHRALCHGSTSGWLWARDATLELRGTALCLLSAAPELWGTELVLPWWDGEESDGAGTGAC